MRARRRPKERAPRRQRVSKPIRSCIACRNRNEQAAFWRVVVAGGETKLWTKQAVGRSAYVCRNSKCLQAAMTAERLKRSLKATIDGDSMRALRQELECKLR
ncbi:MAG: YlxR family protein [Armatimonadetes bacterium]|nr:YlxR family protein [Armatimonadota bacterium]